MNIAKLIGTGQVEKKSDWKERHYYFGVGYCSKDSITEQEAERVFNFLTYRGTVKRNLVQRLLEWSKIYEDFSDEIYSLALIRQKGNEEQKEQLEKLRTSLLNLSKEVK